jgi:hypothetical protein
MVVFLKELFIGKIKGILEKLLFEESNFHDEEDRR